MDKLVITGLHKAFGELQIIRGLNLAVRQGEFLSILGVSGSGKSTLLRLIAGFEQADSGEILLDGVRIGRPSIQRVMIFQDFNQLFPWKTVFENILFPLRMQPRTLTRHDQIERVNALLKLVQLTGFEDYYPHQLSGGMKQRAAIARALVSNPNLLLMDEPFSSLDAQTRTSLQHSLLDIWENTGITIVFVTHDIQEALMLADRVAILDQTTRSIGDVIANPASRPRSAASPQLAELGEEIFRRLGNTKET